MNSPDCENLQAPTSPTEAAASVSSSYTYEQSELLRILSSCVINHPILDRAFGRVRAVIEKNEHLSEPRHLLVVGNAGCGKSTLCDLIESEYGAFDHSFHLGIQRQVGALITSVPSPVTPKAMAAAMLRSLGVTRNLYGTARELTEELVVLLKKSDVKVVVLDEFQHLLSVGENKEIGTCKQLREVQDWVKSLIVKCGVTFVLVGQPTTTALIRSEPQLARRFTEICRLRPFPRPGGTDEEQGGGIIGAFVADLLFAAINETPSFDDTEWREDCPDMALRMHLASEGIPSTVKDLVVQAALIALKAGDRVIRLGHFAAAYRQTLENLNELNEIRRERGDPEVVPQVLNPFAAPVQAVRSKVFEKAA